MWLVICDDGDAAAEWMYAGLRKRSSDSVVLLEGSTLARVERWDHEIGHGRAACALSLHDGQRVCTDAVTGTVNRLRVLPFADAQRVSAEDREYGLQEWNAFFISWLESLPSPVYNAVSPQGLSGKWRTSAEWAILAARAGLLVDDALLDASRIAPVAEDDTPNAVSFIVAAGAVFGRAGYAALSAGCRRLASMAGCAILGVTFRLDQRGRARFHSATPHPDVRHGGESLLDAVAAGLRQERGKGLAS
jgi:hypothetical protein